MRFWRRTGRKSTASSEARRACAYNWLRGAQCSDGNSLSPAGIACSGVLRGSTFPRAALGCFIVTCGSAWRCRRRPMQSHRSQRCIEPALVSEAVISLQQFVRRLLPPSTGGRHAPAEHSLALEPPKEQVLDQQADEDDREQAREHQIRVHFEAVLIDEPADAALAARHAEDHLGGDDRAPGEGPANLDTGQNVGERRW